MPCIFRNRLAYYALLSIRNLTLTAVPCTFLPLQPRAKWGNFVRSYPSANESYPMLTNLEIKKACPKDKAYKLSDANGLFILINPNNGKYWRYKYFFEGKEKLISFGTYPETSLAEAREKRVEAAKLLRNGIDPSAARKQAKQVTAPILNMFE